MPDLDNQLLLPLGPVRNSELFSNYWLGHRLELEPEWLESLAEAERVLERLSKIWSEEKLRVARYGKEAPLEHAFIQPVFEALGWKFYYQAHIQGRKPDYALFSSDSSYDQALTRGHASEAFWTHVNVVADAKAWHVPLDKPSRVDGRKEYPPEQIEWYLSRTGVEWGILTNGRLWRLVPRDVPVGKPRFQTYLEVDLPTLLEEVAARPKRKLHGEDIREFLYFYLLFNPTAFVSEKQRIPLIQRALHGSSEYALGVGEDLKRRVFDALKLSITGFLAHTSNGLSPTSDLETCRENSFVLLYRLLFIMYAEDRGLLPYRINSTYTSNRSLGVFRNEIARILDRRGIQGFSETNTGYWKSLTDLCDLVDSGNARYGVPAYNGGLFSSDQHSFLANNAISDRMLAQVIDALSRSIDSLHEEAGRFRVDYRDLAIRQLGSVYEGLLEMEPRYATQELAIIAATSTKSTSERFHPVSEKVPDGYRDTGERVAPQTIYLATDKGERRSTGSYYTPDHIVDHIVVAALGNLCSRAYDELKSEIAAEEVELKSAQGDKRKKIEDKLAELHAAFADRVLKLRVIDPSMGSGHFLVRACQYLAEEIATNPYTREVPEPELTEESALVYWKRRVAEECLFGVDLNPLAVELAKLALWLETVAKDRPLAFLDTQLRCGNSLVGTKLARLDRLPRGHSLFAGRVEQEFNKQKNELTEMLRRLRAVESLDVASVKAKEKILRQYESRSRAFVVLANIWCEDFFRKENAITDEGYDALIKSLGHPRQLAQLEVTYSAILDSANRLRPFHWEFEFPEMFFASSDSMVHGFDAVIGNPPYDVIASKEAGMDLEPLKGFFQAQPEYAPSFIGKNNLYKLFVCKAVEILRNGGLLGFIVPMALLGDENALGLRKLILDKGAFTEIHAFPQKDDPHNRVFPDAKLSTAIFGMVKTEDSAVKGELFTSTRHSGRLFDADAPFLRLSTASIPQYDPSNMTVVSCDQADWDLAVRLMGLKCFSRLGQWCTSFQGEVNETTDKTLLSDDENDGQEVLRGASICLYAVRDASQGEPKYIDRQRFVTAKARSGKLRHTLEGRIGFQRSAPQNNFRRIIAAPVAAGEFCFDTVSYIPESESRLSPSLLLALLNSQLLEWYFRLGSSNSKLNEYQFDNLPCPAFQPSPMEHTEKIIRKLEPLVAENDLEAILRLGIAEVKPGVSLTMTCRAIIERLAQQICEIETSRGPVTKIARSKLDPRAAVLQAVIDQILFTAAGFSRAEVEGIQMRMDALA